MTRGHWILKGREIVEADLETWGRWFESADRKVAHTAIGPGVTVSTVFLGLDHNFGDGPPLLFETMIFGGDRDGDIARYSTWAQAELGHMETVESLEAVVVASN